MSSNKNILTSEFEALNGLRILVLGDVMLDSYLWGTVDRMSPEAPVPVVSVKNREKRLGGAANVAKNLKALGVEPIVLSVIGLDSDGDEMVKLFEKNGLSTDGLLQSSERITTIKHRIISDKHLLRVDSEQTDDVSYNLEKEILAKFEGLVKGVSCVVFQDYDKGVLTRKVIQGCIELANNFNVSTTVDPKKRNFSNYSNVTLFKPNLKEINDGLGLELSGHDLPEIEKAARKMLMDKGIEKILITLSEFGALLVTEKNTEYVKAHVRDIKDVSGAGDTVISVASAFIGLSSSNEKIIEYSNLSGGLVCEKIGVVPIDKQELFKEALSLGL